MTLAVVTSTGDTFRGMYAYPSLCVFLIRPEGAVEVEPMTADAFLVGVFTVGVIDLLGLQQTVDTNYLIRQVFPKVKLVTCC